MTDGTSLEVVWQGELDGAYLCTVRRLTGTTAELTVAPLAGGPPLLRQQVGLSYGAAFGPDVADVADWEQLAASAVDGQPGGAA